MRTIRATLTATALTAAVAGLSACSAGTTPTAAPPSATAPSAAGASGSASPGAASPDAAPPAATGTLDAANQPSDGKSVTITAVNLQAGGKDGWIALHADLNGKPGPVKYFVAVPAGSSSNVTLPTPGGIPTGAYWPMLHVDDHVIGTYEFPQVAGADLPAKANGAIVMKKITITVH